MEKANLFYSSMHLSLSVCLCFLCSMMEYDTENMNSEEIYSSLRGVTEAIQSFSYRSQEDLNEPIRPESKRDDAVSHVPIKLVDRIDMCSGCASRGRCFAHSSQYFRPVKDSLLSTLKSASVL